MLSHTPQLEGTADQRQGQGPDDLDSRSTKHCMATFSHSSSVARSFPGIDAITLPRRPPEAAMAVLMAVCIAAARSAVSAVLSASASTPFAAVQGADVVAAVSVAPASVPWR